MKHLNRSNSGTHPSVPFKTIVRITIWKHSARRSLIPLLSPSTESGSNRDTIQGVSAICVFQFVPCYRCKNTIALAISSHQQ